MYKEADATKMALKSELVAQCNGFAKLLSCIQASPSLVACLVNLFELSLTDRLTGNSNKGEPAIGRAMYCLGLIICQKVYERESRTEDQWVDE